MAAEILAFPSQAKSAAQPSAGVDNVAMQTHSVQMTHATNLFAMLLTSVRAWAKARAERRQQKWEMRYWTPEVYADHHIQAPVMWRESHQTFWK